MSATTGVRVYYSELGRVRMLGGDRALDLANTLHWRDGAMIDFVPDYRALADWCVPAQLMSEEEAADVLACLPSHVAKAGAVHAEWIGLRAAFKHWLAEIAPRKARSPRKSFSSGPAYERIIAAIDHALARVGPLDLLDMKQFPSAGGLLRLPLRRSAAAIMALMLFPPEGRIRQCEADQCGGFFIDRSRSRPRRWCAMDSCGNRSKVAQYRQRNKG